MSPAIATRKQELADRLMRINQAEFLNQVEELILRAEMQARVDESLDDIENGCVLTLEQFKKGTEEWMRANGIM
jgi:predicted transcriptional regulator